jgi:hypothetical protein
MPNGCCEPLIRWRVTAGRKRSVNAREVINRGFYILRPADAVREQEGREASPTVATISPNTKGAQKGGDWADHSGYEAGKKKQASKAAHPGRHAG